jgi:hypothetical protein
VFGESYHETFAAIGVRLGKEDECAGADIEDAEKELGIRIPTCLKDYYVVCGREKQINQFHDRLLAPDEWFVDAERLIFMEENQRVVFWGIPASQQRTKDAAVFQGVNLEGESIEWHPEHDSCFTFLNVMAIWHASGGGAAANTAVGYVDERSTRKALDVHWKLVGEVNGMRAYTQSGRALCFLKWEDSIQKKSRLPPWRVYAAAATEADLERIKTSLQAQWGVL